MASDKFTVNKYEVHISGNRTRKLSLDGRIPINNIQNNDAKERISSRISEVSDLLDIDPSISESLKGVVFEERKVFHRFFLPGIKNANTNVTTKIIKITKKDCFIAVCVAVFTMLLNSFTLSSGNWERSISACSPFIFSA
ncbi:hypothetical protein C5S29_09425 [ANME-1 cluster archaeon GoMg3.2]|nr:hypothetical protein [ANME-1 cluster archaeon GoMg3.2]